MSLLFGPLPWKTGLLRVGLTALLTWNAIGMGEYSIPTANHVITDNS